jgi:alcohol dehydrogenase
VDKKFMMIQHFEFHPSIQVIFGENSLKRLHDQVSAFGCENLLIVTDRGIIDAGILDKTLHALKNARFNIHIFKDLESNPTTAHVDQGVAFGQDKNIDVIVGLGGGSAMDCAKGINFLLCNGGKMEDYWGKNKAKNKMLPSIGIPTTGGTGSEAQSFAIIAQKDSHIKMACGDFKARFKTVILDPDLLKSVPRHTAVVTGIDAISHALESYVSTAANPFSKMFAREAWQLLSNNIHELLNNPEDHNSLGNMLLGAHLAGHAIENSMLGAAHAMANPLSARTDIEHGVAVGIALPHVIEFNAKTQFHLYQGLSFKNGQQPLKKTSVNPLIEKINSILENEKISLKLRDYGIVSDDLDSLATAAMANWTAQFNPRPLTHDEFKALYDNAL